MIRLRVHVGAIGYNSVNVIHDRFIRRQSGRWSEHLRFGELCSQLRVLTLDDGQFVSQSLDFRFRLLEIALQLFDVLPTAFSTAPCCLAIAVTYLLLTWIVRFETCIEIVRYGRCCRARR